MENDLGRAGQCFHGSLNELLTRLTQHLNGDAIGNAAFVDDAANEVEVRLRRRREANLDFRKADLEQQVEHAQLFLHVHGIDQGLVAVPQIHAAPARRAFKGPARPLPAGQVDGRKRAVLVERHRAAGTAARLMGR